MAQLFSLGGLWHTKLSSVTFCTLSFRVAAGADLSAALDELERAEAGYPRARDQLIDLSGVTHDDLTGVDIEQTCGGVGPIGYRIRCARLLSPHACWIMEWRGCFRYEMNSKTFILASFTRWQKRKRGWPATVRILVDGLFAAS